MVTADQLVAHAIGDYLLQTDWMATEKTKRAVPALSHALAYSIPFIFLTSSWIALSIIIGTHFVIDRYRLARYVVWAKNQFAPKAYRHPWQECLGTGYHWERPVWLSTWLLIIADNTLHVCCNAVAIAWT